MFRSTSTCLHEARHLRSMLAHAIKEGTFTLASGATSKYYLDAREVTLSPGGARAAGWLLRSLAVRWGANVVAGPTTAACPLVTAASIVSLDHDTERQFVGTAPLKGVYVRSAAKDHGMGKQVEGFLLPNDRVLLVDDVVTSGGSLRRAAEALAPATIVGVAALVDRSEGAAWEVIQKFAPQYYYHASFAALLKKLPELRRRDAGAEPAVAPLDDLDNLGGTHYLRVATS